jgi:hypothetical protein
VHSNRQEHQRFSSGNTNQPDQKQGRRGDQVVVGLITFPAGGGGITGGLANAPSTLPISPQAQSLFIPTFVSQ